ncbi:ABC transporter ATP-binding protein [Mesoterricola silvestris]|uniref:ABC transporter ATP-binding protein n=1 Tax=Mesoterricola silvestris TaxID=2927979 RepID=A0AA48K7A6_9BACT|nr:ABC transporter ATP-binding protein [Mesoterricola silvestris]BDU70970.1 ABC transporter ATP-binding protein [Mesoterricola silvestris]
MISLQRASLRYGDILGLSPTSFHLGPEGGITGLLGPNGAGKSSLIQLLSGLLPPSGGQVEIFGEAPFRNPAVLSRLGLVPEGDRFPGGMRADRWLRMMAQLSGLEGRALDLALRRALAITGMEARAAQPFTSMSKGMRQRIRLAQALLHEPRLLILDEPFNGLDPEARLQLMDLLRMLAGGGTRVLVSSHILGEVAQLTDRILLLFRGRLLAEGSVPEIRELLDRHPVELRVTAESATAVARWAVEQDELVGLRMEEGGAVLAVRNPRTFLPRLQEAVVDGRLPLAALDPLDLNLDAVFQFLTKDHQ